jgi:hypothetical protein
MGKPKRDGTSTVGRLYWGGFEDVKRWKVCHRGRVLRRFSLYDPTWISCQASFPQGVQGSPKLTSASIKSACCATIIIRGNLATAGREHAHDSSPFSGSSHAYRPSPIKGNMLRAIRRLRPDRLAASLCLKNLRSHTALAFCFRLKIPPMSKYLPGERAVPASPPANDLPPWLGTEKLPGERHV